MGIYGEEKMRELQKSFVGMFYRKVLWESFRKSFTESFYRKVLSESFPESFLESFTGKFYEKKVLRGKRGTRFGLRLGKLLIRHSSSDGHRFTSFSGFT